MPNSFPLRFRTQALLGGLLLSCATFIAQAQQASPPSNAEIYESACAKCHSGGPGAFFTRAPKLSDKVWADRLAAAGSVDALVLSVARGKGKMPPQLGLPRSKQEPDSRLTEADLRSAVTYMLEKTGLEKTGTSAP